MASDSRQKHRGQTGTPDEILPAALEVSLVIPTIPEREKLLERALTSAKNQVHPFAEIIVERAEAGDDAAVTRQRGFEKVTTEWVSFLDDDDELEPHHLSELVKVQTHHNSDIVYPWFTPYQNGNSLVGDFGMLQLNGRSPFGKPWGRAHSQALSDGQWCFHLTALFRAELIKAVGGFNAPGRAQRGAYLSEDIDLERRLVAQGATVHHCAQRTWRWHFWDGQTKGQPEKYR